MPLLSINIPNGEATRIINALAARFNYQATLPDGSANPQTKQEFVRLQIIRWVKEQVKAAEGNSAAETARTAAEQSVEAINIT